MFQLEIKSIVSPPATMHTCRI